MMHLVAAEDRNHKRSSQSSQERSSLYALNSPFLFYTLGAHWNSSQLCRRDPIWHRHIYIYLTIDFFQLPGTVCVYMC